MESSSNTETLIRTEHVCRTYSLGLETVHALQDVSVHIPAGKMVLIQGKSGSGKTTLLNVMGGLERPSDGSVWYQKKCLTDFSERDMTAWRRQNIGFVFQSFALLPGLTALENVDLPCRIAGLLPRKATERAMYCLQLVGLGKRVLHRVSELSGGEQQRVAIARGIVNEPEIVFADEPTGELDRSVGSLVLELFMTMIDDRKVTICLTSHDPAVRDYAHVLYTLSDGKLAE